MTVPTKDQLALAPWMAHARGERGVAEVRGEGDNPRVLGYLASCTPGRPLLAHDSTPWCSAFVNWVLKQSGIARTRSRAARSWLRYGDPVLRSEMRYGDIVVLWRGIKLGPDVLNAPGHVGFADYWDARDVHLFAGNQGDTVSIHPFPWSRVIAIRRPTETAIAAARAIRGLEGA